MVCDPNGKRTLVARGTRSTTTPSVVWLRRPQWPSRSPTTAPLAAGVDPASHVDGALAPFAGLEVGAEGWLGGQGQEDQRGGVRGGGVVGIDGFHPHFGLGHARGLGAAGGRGRFGPRSAWMHLAQFLGLRWGAVGS